MPKPRNFNDYIEKIMQILSNGKLKQSFETYRYDNLDDPVFNSEYYDPCSVKWEAYGAWLKENVKPNSKDKTSIALYAILCDKTPDEMKLLMERLGD